MVPKLVYFVLRKEFLSLDEMAPCISERVSKVLFVIDKLISSMLFHSLGSEWSSWAVWASVDERYGRPG